MGQNPARLAADIHRQIGRIEAAIPIVDIAYALDIQSIEARPLQGCEGALIAKPNKHKGSIAYKQGMGTARSRYTIAHELGHFLNPGHIPSSMSGGEHGNFGFQCSKDDMSMRGGRATKLTPYQRKELEANQFAAEILMPKYKMRRFTESSPDLRHILEITKALNVSKEAAANRYTALHDETIAIAFLRDGRVRYWAKGKDFPRVLSWNGEPLLKNNETLISGVSGITYVNPEAWLEHEREMELSMQTLGQNEGFGMCMLAVDDQSADYDEQRDEDKY